MIIVTGGAGFIGSNLMHTLADKGHHNLLVVDDLTNGHKYTNILNKAVSDYLDKSTFIKQITDNPKYFGSIEAIFHQGACSETTEWNGQYMMENNFEYSKNLLHYCQALNTSFIYASSAAVYGHQKTFKEEITYENPLNVYGYSKWLFDQYVRKNQQNFTSQVVGLRYFNVYGPREAHKGSMSSVMYHFNNQVKDNQKVNLFKGCDEYDNGEQRRDFIYVEDISNINLWFLNNKSKSGIFNAGSGESRSFNDVANTILNWHEKNENRKGKINYIDFPTGLKEAYQSYTQADLTNLKSIGYNQEFHSLEDGINKYLNWLNKSDK